MAQLQKKFIADNAVGAAKVRLENNANLKARNAANDADVNILKVNASDRIEFASVPQSTADAAVGNDLVRYSQLVTAVEGLKPKQAVAVASTADIDLAVAADPSPIDGYTLQNGDRILLKDQTDPAENGIYDAVTAADPTTWVRSADYNNVSEIPGSYTVAQNGTVGQGVLYVTTSSPAVLGTDPIVFVNRVDSAGTGGDMITVTGNEISVDLAAVSGLESTNPGNAAGELRVKLEASNPTLQITGSNELAAKLDAAGAIVTGASGLAVAVDGSTVAIVGNELQALQPAEERITLNGTDITNQYVDLAQEAFGSSASVNSVSLFVVGGLSQLKTVDYTVALTGGAGGVTRITFAGDLATGGAAELIAGDILVICYEYMA